MSDEDEDESEVEDEYSDSIQSDDEVKVEKSR